MDEFEVSELLEYFDSRVDPTMKLADPGLVIFYKNLETNDLWLDANINWANCAFLVQYIQYLNKITPNPEQAEPIRLHIMCNGGELSTMFAIYNTIKNSKIPIYTINESACHSAAFIIFLAGQKRYMNVDGVFCAHEGSGGLGGTYRESKAAMANYDKDVARMREIIAAETNLSVEEVESRFAQESDWYIRYEDAKQLGILKE